MGGRGSSSGAAGGTMTASQAVSAINRTPFTNNGGGNWELDIPGVGGGSILDETGGSRDPMHGFGGKVYGVTAWDKDYKQVGIIEYIATSINGAKRALKDKLINLVTGRG